MIVFDASALVSAALKADSVLERALLRAEEFDVFALSAVVDAEIAEVLARPKFAQALPLQRRQRVLEILRSAARKEKQRAGRGLDDVDASRLRVKRRDDARGILDQTLVAAFANPELAEHALDFIREHSRVELKESAVVKSDRDPMLDRIGEFAADARKALALGNGILTLRVDEADAFEARELLDEDTRSRWTMTMPPRPAA